MEEDKVFLLLLLLESSAEDKLPSPNPKHTGKKLLCHLQRSYQRKEFEDYGDF